MMYHVNGLPVAYWDAPDFQIANNSRAGSVAVHHALCEKYGNPGGVYGISTKPVHMLIREPVARFVSAMKYARRWGRTEPATDFLCTSSGEHFQFQYVFAIKNASLYKFPEHLDRFEKATGLKLRHVNQSFEQFVLTDEELAAVRKYYSDDVELFNSIERS
jgi:hypothetical protein